MLKLGMVSLFYPHSMCAKVERITAKTGCTSCTNLTISFKVRGFQRKTRLFQRHFIFINLFQLNTFFASNMQHSKPHTKISTLSDFIFYFSSFDLHSMCAKGERITAKTGCTSCTNLAISFKVRGFQTKTLLFEKNSIF